MLLLCFCAQRCKSARLCSEPSRRGRLASCPRNTPAGARATSSGRRGAASRGKSNLCTPFTSLREGRRLGGSAQERLGTCLGRSRLAGDGFAAQRQVAGTCCYNSARSPAALAASFESARQLPRRACTLSLSEPSLQRRAPGSRCELEAFKAGACRGLAPSAPAMRAAQWLGQARGWGDGARTAALRVLDVVSGAILAVGSRLVRLPSRTLHHTHFAPALCAAGTDARRSICLTRYFGRERSGDRGQPTA